MVKTLTFRLDMPDDRTLHLTLPLDVPDGPLEVVLVIAPATPATITAPIGHLLVRLL
ncbi:MAG: hypothetical protein HYR94_30375 [Chloroflexi bacterium]|nr:hypothetical protein [Chloroflexota bacterium]